MGIYFHANEDQTSNKDEPIETNSNDKNIFRNAFIKLVCNFQTSFSQGSVFRWSLWWALGMCGNYQFVIYGIYSFGISAIFLLGFIANGFRKGWTNFLKDVKKQGLWKPKKEGEEEDCEGRQLSLGGAI